MPACALCHHAPHAPMCVLHACARPACPRAPCAITHHTRRCASCMLVCVLYAGGLPVPSCTTHADVRPACLRASCMPARVRPAPSRTTRPLRAPCAIMHHTRRGASCLPACVLCHLAPHAPMCVL